MKTAKFLASLFITLSILSCKKDGNETDPTNNSETNRLKTIEFSLRGEEIKREKYEYTFNEKNIVKQIKHSGETLKGAFNETYDLTQDGDTLIHRYKNPTPPTDNEYSIQKYYTKNGRLLQFINNGYDKEDKLISIHTETYVYNSGDQLTQIVLWDKDVEYEVENENSYELVYNSNGKVIKIISRYYNEVTSTEEFTYSGNQITSSLYYDDSDDSDDETVYKYEYSNDGLIKVTEYEEGEITSITDISYVAKGLIKSITSKDDDGEVYAVENRTYESGNSNSKYIYFDSFYDFFQKDFSSFRVNTKKSKPITFKNLYLKGRL